MSIADQRFVRSGFQNFVLFSFVVLFFIPGLSKQGFLPRAFYLAPEILSGLAVFGIFFCVLRGLPLMIKKQYIIVLVLLLVSTILGAIANEVGSGPFISGLRHYLKYLPFFLLPFVYAFSEKDIKQQLQLIAFLLACQVPISLYQRFVIGASHVSGDIVRGMFTSGGHQALFSFSALAIVVVFYMRGQLNLFRVCLLFVIALLPNLFNETKSSVVFLATILIFPLIVISPSRLSVKRMTPIFIAGAAFIAVFYISYQAFFLQTNKRYDTTAEAFSTERLETYLTRASEEKERYGRFAKIQLSFETLAENPIDLIFGLGLGNTTESVLGSRFEGQYFDDYELIKGATIAYILFDLGFIGLLLCLYFYLILWKDSRRLARYNDLYGALAHGWLVVLVLALLGFTYRSVIQANMIGYFLTFFCGVIAAESGRRQIAKSPQNSMAGRKGLSKNLA